MTQNDTKDTNQGEINTWYQICCLSVRTDYTAELVNCTEFVEAVDLIKEVSSAASLCRKKTPKRTQPHQSCAPRLLWPMMTTAYMEIINARRDETGKGQQPRLVSHTSVRAPASGEGGEAQSRAVSAFTFQPSTNCRAWSLVNCEGSGR